MPNINKTKFSKNKKRVNCDIARPVQYSANLKKKSANSKIFQVLPLAHWKPLLSKPFCG